MKELLEALTILAKYEQPDYPTSCEHDMLYVHINPKKVSSADRARLEDLGFHASDRDGNFYSFRFGSA